MTTELKTASVLATCGDLREEFREAMEAKAWEFRKSGAWFKAAKLKRALKNDRIFERCYNFALHAAANQYVDSQEYGDGEFAKWFLEWWANGGWESIIAFMEALLPLLGAFG